MSVLPLTVLAASVAVASSSSGAAAPELDGTMAVVALGLMGAIVAYLKETRAK